MQTKFPVFTGINFHIYISFCNLNSHLAYPRHSTIFSTDIKHFSRPLAKPPCDRIAQVFLRGSSQLSFNSKRVNLEVFFQRRHSIALESVRDLLRHAEDVLNPFTFIIGQLSIAGKGAVNIEGTWFGLWQMIAVKRSAWFEGENLAKGKQ